MMSAVSGEIKKCSPKAVKDWEEYYYKNVYSKEHLVGIIVQQPPGFSPKRWFTFSKILPDRFCRGGRGGFSGWLGKFRTGRPRMPSGHGCPAIYEVRQSEAQQASVNPTPLGRRKASP